MKILITGGAGFQGSHLAEHWLRSGHKITILNTFSEEAKTNIAGFEKDLDLVWGSVTDAEVVEKTARGQDVVVHLAAHINVDESLTAPKRFVEVNVAGTTNVLEAVRRTGARLIFASSCEVYGHALQSPVSERAELRPYSPYAASKAGADRMCFSYHHSFKMDITIVRPGNVFGPRQKSGRGGAVIPIFTSLALAGKPLNVFGDGKQTREYIHVHDLVKVYDLVLNRSDLAGATLNAGTGETPSIAEIARFIAGRTGVEILHKPPRPGEVPGFYLDSSTIRGYGFEPEVKFWDGLADYIEYAKAAGL